MFPSPCGEKIGKNRSNIQRRAPTSVGVSVPLRGKDRKKLPLGKTYRADDTRFRPLAGKR